MPRLKHTRAQAALDDWHECIGQTEPPPGIAIDTETEGFEWSDSAFCATIAWEDVIGRVSSHYLPLPEANEALGEIMRTASEHSAVWVFHNAKFDLEKLVALGVVSRADLAPAELRFTDTQALAIYLDNLQKLKLKGKGTANLVHAYLGRDSTAEFDALAAKKTEIGLKADDGYHLLPSSVLLPYAIRDAKDTYELWRALRSEFPERFDKHIVREMRVTLALLDMETAGMGVDVDYLAEQRDVLGVKLVEADNAVREMACQITGKTDWTPPSARPKGKPKHPDQLALGDDSAFVRRPRNTRPFKPGSPQQLAEVLQTIGYELPLTEKGQPRTDDSLLKRLRNKTPHPFLDAIAEYRRMQKLHATYITGILREEVDGVLHASFRQYGTRTGRFSSGGAGDE